MKYISSKDLNSDNEFVTTLHLNKDSEYIIKYSHGGRPLNDSLLGLRISAPDGKEMILDLLSADMEVSEDVINDTTPKNPNELSPEELEREKALDEKAKEEEMEAPLYVSTDIEIILEENPCIVLYRFKAPQTGDYQFAVSELTLSDDLGGLVRNATPDVPFEFRLYGSAEAHSVFDGEGIEISPRDILDIQRILLYSATEFNENGLPVDFELTGDEEGTAEVRLTSPASTPAGQIKAKLQKPYTITGNKVIPAAVIDNIPYDDLFEEGAGFYAHSGLRAVTNVIDDEAFSKNAVDKFTLPKPGTGGEASFSLRDFASSLGTFIKSARGVNRSQYQQLYVTLRRFREIKDARPYIPEALTVGADLYTAIRSLTEKIFRTRCYYNALMVLPASQLRGGKGLQDGWEQEFEVQLINKVDRGLNYICADKGQVKEYQGKFDKLYKKYKALAERYNFYCYFMRIQKSYAGSSPSWTDSKDSEDIYYTI